MEQLVAPTKRKRTNRYRAKWEHREEQAAHEMLASSDPPDGDGFVGCKIIYHWDGYGDCEGFVSACEPTLKSWVLEFDDGETTSVDLEDLRMVLAHHEECEKNGYSSDIHRYQPQPKMEGKIAKARKTAAHEKALQAAAQEPPKKRAKSEVCETMQPPQQAAEDEVAHNQAVVPEQELKQINIQRSDSQQLCDNQEAVARVNHSAGLAKRTRRLFSHRNKSQLLEQSDFDTTEDTTEPAVGQLESEVGSSISMFSSVNVCSSVRVSIDSNKVSEQASEYDQCMQNMVLDLHADSFSAKRDPASKSTRRLFKSKRIKGM